MSNSTNLGVKMNPSVLISLLLLSLLGGAISFPDDRGNGVVQTEDERQSNEIVPSDTPSSEEDSDEDSFLTSAFFRFLMLMQAIRDTFKPSVMFLRIHIIMLDDDDNSTQPENGNYTSDKGIDLPSNISDSEIKLGEGVITDVNDETDEGNKQNVETNTEAPPSVDKEQEGSGDSGHETEHDEHKENEKQTPETSDTTAVQVEPSKVQVGDEKQTPEHTEHSTPAPQEPNDEENEVIPHEEAKSNGEEKSFLANAASKIGEFFSNLFG